MSWAAAAVAGGAIVGGVLSSQGAKSAANEQSKASGAAVAEQARQFDLARSDSAPYRQAGATAVGRLSDMMGLGSSSRGPTSAVNGFVPKEQFDANAYLKNNPDVAANPYYGQNPYEHYLQHGMTEGRQGYQLGDFTQAADNAPLTQKFTTADFENDPVVQLGLKYGLDMGTKAIDRGAGAAGLRNSGATLKALTRFGQDYAGSKANESYNRFYGDQDRIFNRLSGIAGTGQTATQNTSMLGQASAQNIGNLLTAQGNARGAAAIGQANAYGGAINTIGGYYGQQATLDKILKSRTPTSGTIYQTGMD